jgi:hypothetical protein
MTMKYQFFIDYCSSHAWLKKSFSKLRKDDFVIIEKFLSIEFQSKDDAMSACNRIFLNNPRTKNWLCVMETLSGFITHSYP